MTDREWALIDPFMPAPCRIGRPRKTDLREVVNAVLYMASTGRQWRQLPKDFPPVSTVQRYFYEWRDNRLWQTIREAAETFVLESSKGSGSWTASRAGKARKRGLSREQVPILVAAGRAGEILSHTLPALNADSVKEVLEPVVVPDALLVSEANRCYPPVAAALDIPHESITASAGERVRGALHI